MEAERDVEGSVGSVPPLMLAAKLLILIIIYFYLCHIMILH